MKFAPKTSQEVQKKQAEFGLWPKGTYDFEVAEATDETSSAGNDMIKLLLHVFDADGKRRIVFDYLLPAMDVKLFHAAECMGLSDKYMKGDLEAADVEGRTGRLILYIKKGQNGYPDNNAVADYVRPADGAPEMKVGTRPPAVSRSRVKSEAAGMGSDLDDEIPF